MIAQRDKDFMRLIMRSRDEGEGWREVSKVLWKFVESFGQQELIEKDARADGTGRVRLSNKGNVVAEYLI